MLKVDDRYSPSSVREGRRGVPQGPIASVPPHTQILARRWSQGRICWTAWKRISGGRHRTPLDSGGSSIVPRVQELDPHCLKPALSLWTSDRTGVLQKTRMKSRSRIKASKVNAQVVALCHGWNPQSVWSSRLLVGHLRHQCKAAVSNSMPSAKTSRARCE